MGQADWVTVPIATDDVEGPIFFTPHEWDTIEAATARIIPTDHHPGAREAKVVRFIDRMLAGTQFVFAAADGVGFLRMEGLEEQAWRERVDTRRAFYREGIERLDALARAKANRDFVGLSEDEQDAVLEELAGAPRPARYSVSSDANEGKGGAPAGNQPVNEDLLEFFPLLVLNTRQGFYADPVYGGNAHRIGWAVVGFDGPPTLKSTMDGSYTTRKYMVEGAEWPYDRHPEVLRYRR